MIPEARNIKNSKRVMTECVYIIHAGHAVVQVVEALSYKPKGRGFDS